MRAVPPYPVQDFPEPPPPSHGEQFYQSLSFPYPALILIFTYVSGAQFFCDPHRPVTAKNECGLTPCMLFSGTALMINSSLYLRL